MDPRLNGPSITWDESDWREFHRQLRRDRRHQLGRWLLCSTLFVATVFSGVTVSRFEEARDRRCFVYERPGGEPEYWDYTRPGCGGD